MRSTSPQNDRFVLPAEVNSVSEGRGAPVVLIHGMAASLHDWDDLTPALAGEGYSAHALDLLGHGESPKPEDRLYNIEWLFDHLSAWIDSLKLDEPAVVIGHSLGGYLALEAARRRPESVRALVLVDPFYRREQLPALLRLTYRNPGLTLRMIDRLPEWMLRAVVDATSLSLGHSPGGAHNLPEHIRAQTALDYKRTAPGVYHLPNTIADLSLHLEEIKQPSLLVWGTRDTTLSPASFKELADRLPNARARWLRAGHVPHQSHADEFNGMVLEFLKSL